MSQLDQSKYDLTLGLNVVKGHSVVIQAGGRSGHDAKTLSKLFSLVISFEPDPINFQLMRATLSETNNVVAFEAYLGKERGNSNNIPMTVIDELKFTQQETGEIGIVDLITLNVKGKELEILMGAHETIMRDHPVIQVSQPSAEIAAFLMSRAYDETVPGVYQFTGIARAFGVGHKHGDW